MPEEITTFISLTKLARRLGIAAHWLRREAKDNRIPHLVVNGRLRFNLEAVKAALLERQVNMTEGEVN